MDGGGLDMGGGVGAGCLLVLLLVGLIVVAVAMLPAVLQEVNDSAAARAYARAAEVRAQENLEEARSRNWEQRFMLYNISMAAWMGGFNIQDLVLVVAVAGLAVVGGYLVGLRRG